MRHYLSLQFRILNRQLDEFGIKPVYGFLVGALIMGGMTMYLWAVTEYAPYVYALLGLSMTSLLADPGKINFIRQHFPGGDLRRIRATENLIVVFPFVIGLVVYQEWLMAMAVMIVALVLSYSSASPSFSIVIPTPFSRNPFEFTTGFRKNIFVLVLAAFLLVMAIIYSNANLGLFACALVLLLSLTFYMSAEQTYLVWIYNRNPAGFIMLKIRNAILSASLLFLPFAVTFLIVFPSHSLYLLAIYILGLLYLTTSILGKYAFYPSAMNLPQGIVMALSFWFPPILLFLIPYFYRRATDKLQPYLT